MMPDFLCHNSGGALKPDILLNFTDNRQKAGILRSPFHPDDETIHVSFSSNGGQRVPLAGLCSIQMLNKPDSIESSQEMSFLEEVETTAGIQYYVKVLENQTHKSGFYGISTEKDAPYKYIFFPFSGLRARRQNRPLGEILEQKGFITRKDIEIMLREQERLKHRRVGEIIADQNHIQQNRIDQAIEKAKKNSKQNQNLRIGDILVSEGLITQKQLLDALEIQKSDKKKKIGTLLIEKGLVSEDQILSALATKFRLRFIDLEPVEPTDETLESLPKAMVTRLQIFPIDVDTNRIVVATANPTDISIIDTLHFYAHRRVELVVATSAQISKAIETYYLKSDDQVEDIIGEMAEDEVSSVEDEVDDGDLHETDSKIIKLVNKILIDAFAKGVSDIHFEPAIGKKPFNVRYRVDGICHPAHRIPAVYNRPLISRIKIISNLDIAERRKPQSGKIVIRYKKRKIEYRVEVTPTVGGNEDAVLRILSASKPMPLEEMGFSTGNLKNFKHLLGKPYGIILCVGPTGSGKTTTLHSGLGHINSPERKIWTAEDPVEITQEGLRQVQVNPKIGFTFSEALRSFLRADPDVIMIGEMRDAETAKIGIEASLTGHLVFSTLHTNSASETIVRLIEMGMDPFNFADAFLGVLAQRLARRLCRECKTAYHPDHNEYDDLVTAYGPEYFKASGLPEYAPDLTLMKPTGCDVCGNIGYKGRIAVHELLTASESMKIAIKKNATAEEIKNIALNEGMRTLKMDGIEKIFKGITDFNQILRVCM